MSTNPPPFKALDVLAVVQYAAGIAIREAIVDGVLTPEEGKRISERADEIKNALVDGKVVQLEKDGHATIRVATDDEEAEMDPGQFPMHTKAKTVLDI